MKIVIAPDSFKESLTAQQVCLAIETGFKRVFPNAQYIAIPVADGGEGTVQSLVDATGGKIVKLSVTGPLGKPVDAFYGLLADQQTAVIEMAAASGLDHVPSALRDPKKTTSYGTGELIKAALDSGVKKLIIGLGGSATNDGGIGMLSALGARFIDNQGNDVSLNGAGLQQIQQIDISALDKRLLHCEIFIACDVDNPLCGPQGASAIFGPQKGASNEDIALLDDGLLHYSQMIQETFSLDLKDRSGMGAAGGMAIAFAAFTNANMQTGITLVLETVKLADHLTGADLVITGEGRIDAQTVHGKTPMGVAQAAKKLNLPVIAIAGCLGEKHQAVYRCGIDAVFAATPQAMSLQEAFDKAAENVANVAENIARMWSLK
ncbi:glycerate kinase [Psychromonas sp. Urea-02u-13]|uniref:glycerate kinase n=1 Tax=Psychromonas sp. Urea-02u-13 TaxID=2058326 RepID=UPI000C3224D6|nr:glycerate kinase [Psychromonas sp. Urea-02u-13]PKG38077.1 glycerate kinase [Psychromonas sp. Urea-02u-13]